MAILTLREAFKKDLVESFLPADPVRESPFWLSGAVRSDNRISRLLASGSQSFEVPYLNPISAKLEPNYSNTIVTDIAVPNVINAGKMKGLMAYLNESWLESHLETYLIGFEPLREIAKQIAGYWQEQTEERLIATLIGLRNYDQGNGKKFTTEKAAVFSVADFIQVEGTMASKYRGKGALVINPAVATQLRLAKLLIPFQDPANLTAVETYNGRRVIESTNGTMTKTGSTVKYVSYFLNEGAFAGESVADREDLELERTASTGNGGGHTTLWTRRNMLIHPTGFSFIADPVTLTGGTKNEAISASWSDLTTAANWKLEVDEQIVDKLPFRILVNNAA